MASDGIELTYLFAVRYRDGSKYQQAPDDSSVFHPGQTAWADVNQEEVEILLLRGRGRQHFVDLRTGFFYVEGTKVAIGEDPPHSPEVAPFRPVYHRQVRRERQVKFEVQKNRLIGEPVAVGPELVTVRFCIGWVSVIDGKPVTQTLGLY